MASLTSTITVTIERRAAEVTLTDYWIKKYNLAPGPHPCNVLGLFQYVEQGDSYPIFVVELQDGRVLETSTGNVRFVENEPIFRKGD